MPKEGGVLELSHVVEVHELVLQSQLSSLDHERILLLYLRFYGEPRKFAYLLNCLVSEELLLKSDAVQRQIQISPLQPVLALFFGEAVGPVFALIDPDDEQLALHGEIVASDPPVLIIEAVENWFVLIEYLIPSVRALRSEELCLVSLDNTQLFIGALVRLNHSIHILKITVLYIKVPGRVNDLQCADLWWNRRPAPVQAKSNKKALLRSEHICVVVVVFLDYLSHRDAFPLQ